ncbi:hypothetical protein J1605_003899, partial [Eschrichtius robustus]
GPNRDSGGTSPPSTTSRNWRQQRGGFSSHLFLSASSSPGTMNPEKLVPCVEGAQAWSEEGQACRNDRGRHPRQGTDVTLTPNLSPVPQNNEKLQESPCIFALTPRQVELIRNSRELQPGVKAVQVVLRICYSDTSSPQEDQYPPNIAVKVNHSYCSVPGYYPSNKPGVEPKRPCRPINLTHLMYLSSATNRITVTWGNYGKSYSVALYLVRQLTSSELLQRLKTIGVKHPELCKALVKEKLRLDPDSEIATTGVRVSLICPVSRGARVCGSGWVDSARRAAAHTRHLPPAQLVKMRLSVPCRAETCAHLQCFDAVFYLQMNEKKPTWMCPVCDKPAPYDQLIIDGTPSQTLPSGNSQLDVWDGRTEPETDIPIACALLGEEEP